MKRYLIYYIGKDGEQHTMFVKATDQNEAKRKAIVRANGIAKRAKKNAGQAWQSFVSITG